MGQESSQLTVVKSINMTSKFLLIDTDVLIDYSRGIEKTKGLSIYQEVRID